jgi:hypothetical protein
VVHRPDHLEPAQGHHCKSAPNLSPPGHVCTRTKHQQAISQVWTMRLDRCYSRDPENVKKYPQRHWVNGVPPDSVTRRYGKKYSQNGARNLRKSDYNSVKQASAPPVTHQSANVAWTPTPIYSAVPGGASTSSAQNPSIPKEESLVAKIDPYELYRQRSRYDFFEPEPEDLTPTHLAMPAEASVGDGFPDISNLW